jgi:hypothetical protein
MNKPLSLLDHQLRQIQAAAKALLPLRRSDFVRGVKRRLGHNPAAKKILARLTDIVSQSETEDRFRFTAALTANMAGPSPMSPNTRASAPSRRTAAAAKHAL